MAAPMGPLTSFQAAGWLAATDCHICLSTGNVKCLLSSCCAVVVAVQTSFAHCKTGAAVALQDKVSTKQEAGPKAFPLPARPKAAAT